MKLHGSYHKARTEIRNRLSVFLHALSIFSNKIVSKKKGIKFNPKNQTVLTYGESLGPAMEIEDFEEAQQYLKDYIAWINYYKIGTEGMRTPEECARINLMYYANNHSDKIAARVHKLFFSTNGKKR